MTLHKKDILWYIWLCYVYSISRISEEGKKEKKTHENGTQVDGGRERCKIEYRHPLLPKMLASEKKNLVIYTSNIYAAHIVYVRSVFSHFSFPILSFIWLLFYFFINLACFRRSHTSHEYFFVRLAFAGCHLLCDESMGWIGYTMHIPFVNI